MYSHNLSEAVQQTKILEIFEHRMELSDIEAYRINFSDSKIVKIYNVTNIKCTNTGRAQRLLCSQQINELSSGITII